MKTEKEIEQICEILRAAYPDVKTQLDYDTPFQLLIATILSAQCTDKQVNAVTPVLFDKFPTPDALAGAPVVEIESLIHSTGFFRNKAKNIQACARAVAEEHDGVIPQDLEGLIQLPGVGRKTANVVLSAAFGQPAVVVDTHVKRISHRLGLTRHSDPTKIEFDLMEILPKSEWNGFGLRLIYFGREICVARKPKCPVCPLFDLCEYPDKHR
ncbi:MAG: endonuclease III [Thermodesulfobacteriota bacterium]